MRSILILIAMCVVVAKCDECGEPEDSVKITDPEQAFPRGSFPWIVALMNIESRPPTFVCSGTLISYTFVISAAHCVRRKNKVEKLLPSDVLAIFGAHDLSNSYEAERTVLSPKNISIHAHLSLLEFEDGKIALSVYIQPICLWGSENEIETEGIVTRWGSGKEPTTLHENLPTLITTLIQTNEQCSKEVKASVDIPSPRTFCAASQNGSRVCSADSGGGLFVNVEGVYHLKGILSSSLIKDDGCDVAVYTNISQFKDWIVNTTQGEKKATCDSEWEELGRNEIKYKTCTINEDIDSEDFVLESEPDTTVEAVKINSRVDYLPREVGEKFPHLKIYDGGGCDVTVLRDHYFKSMKMLQYLNLFNNEIKTIESKAFKDLVRVKELDLDSNKIETLEEKVFYAMIKLEVLMISGNKLKTLSPSTFNIPNGRLKQLDLRENSCVDKGYTADNCEDLEPDLKANCSSTPTTVKPLDLLSVAALAQDVPNEL